MERHAALQVPFRPGNFRPAQPPRASNLDPACPEAQRRGDAALHGTTKRNPFFKLDRDVFRDQLRVEFRFFNFLDGDIDLTTHHFFEIGFQLVDFSAFTANDNTGASSMDDDLCLVARTLNLYL